MRFGTGGDARPRGAGWERLNILVGEAIVGALRSGGEDAIVGWRGSRALWRLRTRLAASLFEKVEKSSRPIRVTTARRRGFQARRSRPSAVMGSTRPQQPQQPPSAFCAAPPTSEGHKVQFLSFLHARLPHQRAPLLRLATSGASANALAASTAGSTFARSSRMPKPSTTCAAALPHRFLASTDGPLVDGDAVAASSLSFSRALAKSAAAF